MPRYRLLLTCALVLAGAALPASAQAQTTVGSACGNARSGHVLVFSKTAGFRHDSIPVGRETICSLAGGEGIAVDWSEDAAVQQFVSLQRAPGRPPR